MNKLQVAKKYQQMPENILMDTATLANKKKDLVDLSIGDPDFTTPQSIITAAFRDAEAGHTKYTASEGSREFLEAVAAFYQEHYQLHFELDQIRATVGAMHGMYLALLAILDPGDEVIVHEPYFTPYKEQIEMAGGTAVFVPTYEEDNFQLDVANLEDVLSERTKAIIINTPNNPTGAVFTDKTMQEIADFAIANDLYILSDEVYEFFCYNAPFTPMAIFAPKHTLTFSSFSKSFAMTGWRIGYMIAPAEINEVVKQINESITYSPPSISQQAGIYALKNRQDLIPEIKETFRERLEYIQQRVQKNTYLSMVPLAGSLYAYINIRLTGLDSVAFVEKVLQETNVLMIPGKAFGHSTGENHVRLAVTQEISVLKEAFDRIDHLNF